MRTPFCRAWKHEALLIARIARYHRDLSKGASARGHRGGMQQ